MTSTPFDVILAGGGLANSLIAWRLRQTRPSLRVLLLEQDAHIGGNHTWSYHDSDLTTAQHRWISPLVSNHWQHYNVIFPNHKRQLESGYSTISSSNFARVIELELGTALRLNAPIEKLTNTAVYLPGGEVLQARAVIDGRGMRPSNKLALGYQTFLGQEVRLSAPHGLTGPIIMDASVEQQGGYRFIYVLPFGPERVLIEDTHYVDTPALESKKLRANIQAYAKARGWRIARIIREEKGSLPIVLAGDICGFWSDLDGQPCAGLRAGLFHPTTGYSLPHAVRLAERIASVDSVDASVLFNSIRNNAVRDWSRQRFFRLLNRMLFLAGEPNNRWSVMQRFYRLPAPLITRFYAEKLTLSDKARLIFGKPPVPVGQALTAALKIHPHQIR